MTTKRIVQKKVTKDVEEEEVKTDVEATEEAEVETPKLKSAVQEREELEKDVEEEGYDYLQQYQYKKVNNVPTVGGPTTDPDRGGKTEVMKKFLLTQRRIDILIPLEPGSDPKVLHSVTLNGYRLDFPTNTYIKVPEAVAEVIRQSNNQTIMALNQFKIDGNSNKENALS